MSYNKKWYKSKTMWASLITALVTHIIPETKAIIAANPEMVLTGVGMLFGLLRITTSEPVGK